MSSEPAPSPFVHNPAMTSGSQVIDQETIRVLKEILASEFNALLDTYSSDAQLRLADIKESAFAERWDAVEIAAHTLKGSSANMGALAFAAACEVLVRTCAKNKVDRAAELIADMERELSYALEALRNERQQ